MFKTLSSLLSTFFFFAVIALVLVITSVWQMSQELPDYLQLAKLVVFCVAAILIIATLINRNPLILLSGPLAGFWERFWRFSLILLGGAVVAALLAWAVGAFRPQKF